VTPETIPLAVSIAKETPIPGRGENDFHLPRFRQEIGPFVAFGGDLSGNLGFGLPIHLQRSTALRFR